MLKKPTIQTERLVFRQWNKKDIKPLAKLYSDPRVMEFWKVKNLEDTVREYNHFVSTIEKNGWGFWAIELRESHEFIGLIGLENVGFKAHFTPAVEIGWRLHYDFWGKGYATEGAIAVLQYGFESLNLNEIVAFTCALNVRSRNVMEKLKMRYNPIDDFDDPDFPEGHPYKRSVLYRITKKEWQKAQKKSKLA